MTTKVKICGTTNFEDAHCATEAGADLLGFIFYPKSPRRIEAAAAKAIVSAIRQQMPPTQAPPQMVGVFVNESLENVLHIMTEVGLDLAQLHGDESPAFLRAANAALSGRAYKALKASSAEVDAYISTGAPALLLDANHPNLYGGSGLRADESIASQVAQRCQLLLAGGLTPDNVADAIRAVQPWGVDVASGVEAAPGRKDHQKVRHFVRAVRDINANF